MVESGADVRIDVLTIKRRHPQHPSSQFIHQVTAYPANPRRQWPVEIKLLWLYAKNVYFTTQFRHKELRKVGKRLQVGGGAHPGGLGAIENDDRTRAALKPNRVDQEEQIRAKATQHSREILGG